MDRWNSAKRAMFADKSNNIAIRTKSQFLVFKTEIDTERCRVLENDYEFADGNGRIESLPIGLDDLVALRNHLSKVILAITLPS